MFTYIGLYLGIIFVISSVVILALQQLSLASDNQKHYEVLSKIGVDNKMVDKSIFRQIFIYFFLPLGLAIVHSSVGIKVVLDFFDTNLGIDTLLTPILISGSIIGIVYIGYFIVTIQSCKKIIHG